MTPTTTMVRIRTVAKTGRLTQILASHCMASSLHSRAVANLGRQRRHDFFAGLEPAHDRNRAVLRVARLDQPVLEASAHRHEHMPERALDAHRARGYRRQRLFAERDLRSHEHPWPQVAGRV